MQSHKPRFCKPRQLHVHNLPLDWGLNEFIDAEAFDGETFFVENSTRGFALNFDEQRIRFDRESDE